MTGYGKSTEVAGREQLICETRKVFMEGQQSELSGSSDRSRED